MPRPRARRSPTSPAPSHKRPAHGATASQRQASDARAASLSSDCTVLSYWSVLLRSASQNPSGDIPERWPTPVLCTIRRYPRAGLLHAVGSSRRCRVVIALESGELPILDRPHVCLRIDKRAAGVPNRCLGIHQGYDLVVLGDELSWLERRVVESRCKTTKPA